MAAGIRAEARKAREVTSEQTPLSWCHVSHALTMSDVDKI